MEAFAFLNDREWLASLPMNFTLMKYFTMAIFIFVIVCIGLEFQSKGYNHENEKE